MLDTPWLRPQFVPVQNNPHALELWEHGECVCCEEFLRYFANAAFHTVFDIGAGYGHATRCIASGWPWAQVIAVDYQSYEVESGECYPGELRLGDAHAVPAEAGSVDAIWSAHCLEHLRSPMDALLDWWRVLVPGGVLGLGVPSDGSIRDGHLWDFSDPKRLVYILALAGFEVGGIVRSGNTLMAMAVKWILPESLFLYDLGIPNQVYVKELTCASE